MNNYNSDKVWFIKNLKNKNLIEKIKKIKIIITDIDGCHTDGSLLISNKTCTNDNDCSNNIAKSFSVQDGYAIRQCVKNNFITIAFLTGRTDEATNIRAKMLGIPNDLCYTGIDQKKIDKVKIIQKKYNINKEETLYFGDDFLDYETLNTIGFMTSPQNTPFYFQDKADLLIPRNGGNNAFRLLLDFILYVQKKHFAQKFISESIKQ